MIREVIGQFSSASARFLVQGMRSGGEGWSVVDGRLVGDGADAGKILGFLPLFWHFSFSYDFDLHSYLLCMIHKQRFTNVPWSVFYLALYLERLFSALTADFMGPFGWRRHWPALQSHQDRRCISVLWPAFDHECVFLGLFFTDNGILGFVLIHATC